jgi:hypothetical protein
MATKTFKYGHLWSKTSGATPNVADMIPGEIALNLYSGDTHIWSTDGVELIDLTSKIGGNGDELSVHAELVNGNKEFSSLVWIKDVTEEEKASLPANVQKRYRLVNAASGNVVTSAITTDDGTVVLPGNESEYIDIYKDSSIVEIYLGTNYDELTDGNKLPVIKKKVGDVVTDPDTGEQHTIDADDFQFLNYVYWSGGFSGETSGTSEYKLTKVDVSKFIVEGEFASGVTANAEGIVTGVVDTLSEKVISAWTDGSFGTPGTGVADADVLTVGEDGFKVDNIQKAIDAKHANVIFMNGYTSGVTEDVFGIASGDTIMAAIKKIEDKVFTNGDGNPTAEQIAANECNTGILFVEGSDDTVILSAGKFGDPQP